MKIKTWLLLSYLIVMILPLISAYLLFAWVTSYHNDQKVEEYYEVYAKIQQINHILRESALYEVDSKEDILSELVSEQVSIKLYNKEAFVLYSSIPETTASIQPNKELIYKNLFELQQGLRAFTYKEPVFEGEEIVGLFEIEVAREEFFTIIVKRGWIVTGLFIISFIIIYATIALIVNNRLNKRLVGLMDEMSAFASGDSYVETTTGKDEIGELKQHFYTMRKQISAAQEAIEQEQEAKEYMVAMISHDLKTPLTSIKAYAESLNNSELSEYEKETYRKVIMDKSDFMKQMLDDLMTHTLLQSKDYEMELVTVDGEEFFDMLTSDYDALCEQKGIELLTCNNVTGDYQVNPKQLMRVADNLMMNAIQHTEKLGKVWFISFSKQKALEAWLFDFVLEKYTFEFEKYMYLIVQNEGEGIPKEKINLLFDPLYQVDQARSKKDTHGTGLGLSITKQIIEKHGGTVEAFSKTNVGACFICSIPKRREEIARENLE